MKLEGVFMPGEKHNIELWDSILSKHEQLKHGISKGNILRYFSTAGGLWQRMRIHSFGRATDNSRMGAWGDCGDYYL